MSLSGGRRLPSQLLVGLEGSGGGRLGSGDSAGWLSDPLRPSTSSIRASALPAGVLPSVHQGSRLNPGASKPSSEGGSRASPQSPGFYNRLFLVQKASGSWRPIIDLFALNDYITSSRFHMETPRSVLSSIRPGDWMISLDLQDAYLQVPVHHDSRRYLRFVVAGKSYQFRVLCFGLTTAPQVFTRIMAPVSAILHRYGVRMLRYLDDWLILASTEIACIQSRDRLLSICTELGIQVNLTKSSLVPTQSLVYLGMEIRSLPFIARPTPVRVNNLIRLIEEFLSTPSPPALLWRRLLGHLSSLTLLVSGGMIRMRLLQLCLKDQWDFLDDQFQVSWSPLCREDLLWWSRVAQLREGASLSLPAPDISFFSDASDVGWGALVGEHHASGLWSPHQKALSINMRELLAVQFGLQAFEHLLVGMSVALFCDNTTTVAYLRRSGGTFSSTLNATAREVLLWVENHRVRLLPQFIMGSSNVTADALKSPQSGDRVGMDPSSGGSGSAGPQMASSNRSVCNLPDSEAYSVFLTSLRSAGSGDRCSSPALGRSPSLCLSSDRHHKESSSQTEVLEELRVDSHSSVLASEGLVPRSSGTIVRRSCHTVKSKRSYKTAPLPPIPPKSAYASADCMATIKRFARQAGFSPAVAGQLIFSRRLSTRLNYQARWGTYRKWCKDFGHRSSSPSIAKIADFLTYMFKSKGAALSTIKRYRAMLSAVFKFPLPEISTSPILKDLIQSFKISAPRPLFPPPPWDLDKVLQYLSGPPFEPLARASFLDKTKKALFLLAMATAKRVSELQALSFSVSFQGEDLVLYYDPFFRAKTESVSNPLPRSIIVPSLSDFAGDLPERVQCPVSAIKFLRKAARSASFIPSRLFVSPRNLERAMSKNAMSFYLRQLIVDSGVVSSSHPPRAHDIRGIATSLNYYSNLSLSNLMQVATWKSNRVFASRYLKEVSATQDNIQQFGPLVITGDRLQPKPPQQSIGCSRSTLLSARLSLSSNFSSSFPD